MAEIFSKSLPRLWGSKDQFQWRIWARQEYWIFNILKWNFSITRMHSSRMRTARPLTVVPVCIMGGGGGVGQWPFLPGGGVELWPRGVVALWPRGGGDQVWPGGGEVTRSDQEGGWWPSLTGGGGDQVWPVDLSHDALHVPPPKVEQTNACENIAFATLSLQSWYYISNQLRFYCPPFFHFFHFFVTAFFLF